MSDPPDGRVLRFAGGAFAIFAGVALALAADDWRLGREEQREAEESLALVAADLRIDSARFDAYSRTASGHAAAAAWLIENWGLPDAPIDSIEAEAYQFYVGGLLTFSRSAYEGLTASNRLRLVGDEAVRTEIGRYYGRTQASLIEFWEFTLQVGTKTLERLAPHFRQPLGERPGTLWPYREERVTMRHEWPTVAEDAVLEETIHQYGVLAQFMADQLTAARDEATDLLHLIEAQQPTSR